MPITMTTANADNSTYSLVRLLDVSDVCITIFCKICSDLDYKNTKKHHKASTDVFAFK